MPKFFIKSDQKNKDIVEIKGQDVKHLRNVLRIKSGDEIQVGNSETMEEYTCRVEKVEKEKIYCKIIKESENNPEIDLQVTIFQGLPKADKMELVIQKSVELGAMQITPVEMKRCIVKFNEKDKNKKIERWQKISEVAAKQCGRSFIPKINNIIELKNICKISKEYDILIVAYEKENKQHIKSILKQLPIKRPLKIGIIIGPEGGLEEEEVQILKDSGVKSVTLGKRILRTETVALNLLSVIMYELEKVEVENEK